MICASSEGGQLDKNEIDNATLTLKRFTGAAAVPEAPVKAKFRREHQAEERIFSITMRFRPDILSTGQDPVMLIRELADNGTIPLDEVTEMRAKEPIVPLRLFRDRTTTLAIIASVAVGVAILGVLVWRILPRTAVGQAPHGNL